MTVLNAKAGETSVEEVVEGLLMAIPESRLDYCDIDDPV